MQDLDCASCNSATLKPPRVVGGHWYALCTTCLFETEIEILEGKIDGATGYRIKGVAGLSALQERDIYRPAPAT